MSSDVAFLRACGKYQKDMKGSDTLLHNIIYLQLESKRKKGRRTERKQETAFHGLHFLNMINSFLFYHVLCNLAADPVCEPGSRYKIVKNIYIFLNIYTHIYIKKTNYSNICYSGIKSAIYKNEITGFYLPLRHLKLAPWD